MHQNFLFFQHTSVPSHVIATSLPLSSRAWSFFSSHRALPFLPEPVCSYLLGHHDKIPQTSGFKQQKSILIVLGTRSAKSRCQQGHTPSETGENPLPLPGSGAWGQFLVFFDLQLCPLQSLPLLSHGVLSVFWCPNSPLILRTPVTFGWSPTLMISS